MKKLESKIKKQKFIIISIMIHLLIIMIFQNYNLFFKGFQKPLKYLEITEIDIPDSNQIKNDSGRLAKNSNKVIKEKIRKSPIKNSNKKSVDSKKSEASNKVLSKEEKKITEKGDLETKDKSEKKKLADKSSKSTESLFNPGPTDPESNDEVTVDFNTQEFKYISYFLRIKRKIEMTWSYPTSSLQRGETGQVVLKITLNKNGKLINSEILESSGYADLDNEAGDAVYQAAPFGPFPSAWTLNKLNVNITFNYSPQGWYY